MPVMTPDVVQRADVRMVECGDGARFAFEAFARLRIVVRRSGARP